MFMLMLIKLLANAFFLVGFKLLFPVTSALDGPLRLLKIMMMLVLLLRRCNRWRQVLCRRVFPQHKCMPHHTYSLLRLHDNRRVESIMVFAGSCFVVCENCCNVIMIRLGLGRVPNAFATIPRPLFFDLPNEPAGIGSGCSLLG